MKPRGGGGGGRAKPHGGGCLPFHLSARSRCICLICTYPYCGGCDLEVMQPAQRALPVGEVGGGQLIEGLQGYRPRSVGVPVAAALDARGRRRLLAELPLVHKYGQRLLPW